MTILSYSLINQPGAFALALSTNHPLLLFFRWPGGGGRGGGGYHPSTGIFKLFLGMERAFWQTTFLAVGSSLGHLSMKKIQIGPTVLVLKLDKGRVLGGWQPPLPIEQKLTYFSNNEDDIQP